MEFFVKQFKQRFWKDSIGSFLVFRKCVAFCSGIFVMVGHGIRKVDIVGDWSMNFYERSPLIWFWNIS